MGRAGLPSRLRRVRVLATFALALVMLYIWSQNVGMPNRDAYLDELRKKGIVGKVGFGIGGGSVIRPQVQEAPLQPPPAPNPPAPPAQPLHPAAPGAPPAKVGEAQDAPAPYDKAQEPTTTPNLIPAKPTPEVAKPKTSSSPFFNDVNPGIHHGLPNKEDQGRKAATTATSVISSSSVPPQHWTKLPEHYPISSTIQLPTGTSIPFPRVQREINKLSMVGADNAKLEAVKAAAKHSWDGYREFAFGHDEVMPMTGAYKDPFNGWGATLVDSLDTLWIMGMKKEFEEAVKETAKIDFTTSSRYDIPLFETVIRYLGGLLGAYDVSGKQYRPLLDKAVELAEVLYSAFDTPNRVPVTYYRWEPSAVMQKHRASTRIVLAEVGTLSLEFTRLAQLTGEPKYYDAVARLTNMLEEMQNTTRVPGMWPSYVDGSGCGLPASSSRGSSHTTTNRQQGSMRRPKASSAVDTLHLAHADMDDDDDNTAPYLNIPDVEGPSTYDHAGASFKAKRELDDISEDPIEQATRDLLQRAPPGIDKLTAALVHDDDGCIPQGLVSPGGATGSSTDTFSLGGGSDSMYEYLTKTYLLLGGQVDQYKTMYLDTMKAIIDKVVFKPMTEDERDILSVGSLNMKPNYSQPLDEREYIPTFVNEISHLGCFAGGMFALGGVIFDQPEHVEIGSKLTDGCVWAYEILPTGIMPESAELMKCDNTFGECKWNQSAWWAELDPYIDTRTRVSQLPPLLTPPRVGQSSHSSSSSVQNSEPHSNLRKADGPIDHSLEARQLDALDDDEDVSDSVLLPPSPSSARGAAAQAKSSYTAPVTQLISHEDYVTKKISDTRLPPGFTRLNSKKYILRPEAIESVFYMYRITGNPHWRAVGWDMWTAVEKYTRTRFGHTALSDVTLPASSQIDSEESFWMAETLKYFYMLFDDPDHWSLDEWVLNTEAHLLRRPEYRFA